MRIAHRSRLFRRSTLSWLVPHALLCVVGIACSGQSSRENPPRCIPGAQVACACGSSQAGTQACGSDGTYGACACPGADASSPGVEAGGALGDANANTGPDGTALDGTVPDVGAGDGTIAEGSTGDGTIAEASAGDAATDGSTADVRVTPDGGGDPCVGSRACAASCADFSASPVLDGATAFTASTATTGGPCLVEPGDGALLPNNWVRPRFRWTGGTAPFKLTLTSPREANPLVVYTASSQWTLDAATWRALAASAWDDGSGADAIQVTVADANGGTAASFSIAPASATGTITSSTVAGDVNGYSWLEAYSVGDEAARVLVTVPTGPYASSSTNVQWTWSRDTGGNLTTKNLDTNAAIPTGAATCTGCHAVAPDGSGLTFIDFFPWDGVATQPTGSPRQPPAWLTPGAAETLSQAGLGMMTFSPALWSTGLRLVIASSQVAANATAVPWSAIGGDANPANLIWIDLETTAAPTFVTPGTSTPVASAAAQSAAPFYANQGTTYGFITRTGDTRSALSPALNHAGTTIAYASNDAPRSGRLDVGHSDIYTVPFDATSKSGGAATPLAGASTTTANEYYPEYSPDDSYLSFNTAPPAASMYYNANAEVDVVPAGGGTATRLRANDPAACTGVASPGATNSTLRWSPDHRSCGGKTYYFLVFASARGQVPFKVTTANFRSAGLSESTSQLYVTAVVDAGGGALTTYPAVYVWPQSTVTSDGFPTSHHTPTWSAAALR